MSDPSFELDVFRDLLDEAGAAGIMAKDEKSFLALYQAFRAGNREAYQADLKRLGLLPRCRLVCEWLRSKECTFLCLDLCGPPTAVEKPDPLQVAEAVIRVTSNKDLLNLLVAALQKRDKAAFQKLVQEEKLGPYCHFFCHWACTVYYRLICRWVCDPDIRVRPDLATELQASGQALRHLVENREAWAAATAASDAGDSAKLGAVLGSAQLYPFCIYLCEWFCSWRCVLVCLTLCRQFPFKQVAVAQEPVEAWQFAKATAALAAQPLQLEKLSTAVGAGDIKGYTALITELKLQPYCLQLCHWICVLRCRLFCVKVCPPIIYRPMFTHVGDFDIDYDIDPGTGRTNKQRNGHAGLHGGPDFGFAGKLQLRGYVPRSSPIDSTVMAYRFVFVHGGTSNVVGPLVDATGDNVGYRWIFWNGMFKRQDIYVRSGGPSPDPPPPSPDPNPPDHYIVPDPQGWITLPAGVQGDAFDGTLVGFRCDVAIPGSPVPAPPLAGSAVPGGDVKNGDSAAIVFQASRVSTIAAVNGGAAPDYTNQLAKIYINNWAVVRELNLLQFTLPGANSCSPLLNDLDIQYTVDHELLRGWSMNVVSASGKNLTTPPPTGPPVSGTPRGGSGTYHENITTWPTCSYAVRLHSQNRITDGIDDDPGSYDEITFCIGKK